MTTILKTLGMLAPVVIVLNFCGGIVGGIWAAFNGDWWAIGFIFLGLVISHWVISILLLPGIVIAGAGATALQKGNVVRGRLTFAVSSLYNAALMAAWSLFATAAFVTHPRKSSLIPMLLLGYGASTAPWAFLASQDQQSGNEYSALPVFVLEAGYVVAGALLLLNPQNPSYFIMTLLVALAFVWCVQQVMMREIAKFEFAAR